MIRDQKTKALLNNDIEKLNKYKAEREQMRKVNALSNEVSDIKEQLSNICRLLEKRVENR